MKVVKTETVTITRDVETDTVCDLCGKSTNDERRSSYDVREVTLKIKNGTSFPEGGDGYVYEPDICLECANDKIVPMLELLNCKATWKSWSR